LIAAVTGATGYVGRFIVKRLIAESVAVRAWRRPASDLRGLPGGVEWVDGDLNSPQSAAALVEGADMLVHAALDHAPGRYRGGEGGDLPGHLLSNVGGGLALLATARAACVSRCVVLSSRAVFGAWPRVGRIADEERPRPDTAYGASKAALEAFVESWGKGEGWPVTAIRPTGVYGVVEPVEKSKWHDMVATLLRGEPVRPRAGTEVHGRDVAEAVWRLLTAPAELVAGRMFNCSDIVVQHQDIARQVYRFAGISGPLPEAAEAPRNVMESAGLERLGVTFGGWPLFEETIAELVEAMRANAIPRDFFLGRSEAETRGPIAAEQSPGFSDRASRVRE
jgi:nucleoside-diphosphate-sugar epimerase